MKTTTIVKKITNGVALSISGIFTLAITLICFAFLLGAVSVPIALIRQMFKVLF